MNKYQREYHASIPKERAEYIPVALILIQYILDRINIESVYFSDYAMKEGIAISQFTEKLMLNLDDERTQII